MVESAAGARHAVAPGRSSRTGPPEVAATASPVRRPDIQMLRALAVALVIAYHAAVPGLGGGYVGVDVFFVISGFLITGQLLRSFAGHAKYRLTDFYARRILRLLPMSTLVIVTIAVWTRLVAAPLEYRGIGGAGRASALYYVNILFWHNQTTYLHSTQPSPYLHYWSLSLEEQYYLAWPALLLAAGLLVRRRRAALTALVGLGTVLSWLYCRRVTALVPQTAFFLLPSRAWEFGVGALVALAAPAIARLPRVAALPLGWAGLAAILAAAAVFDDRTLYPGTAAALPVLGAGALITAGTTAGRAGPGAVLARSPVTWTGERSYGIYLWHWPLLVIPTLNRVEPLPAWARAGLVAATVVLSAVTFHWYEQPLRTSAWLRARRIRPYAFGLALTVVAVAVTTGVGADAPTLYVGDRLPTWPGSAPVSRAPAPTIVGRNLTPGLSAAAGDLAAQRCLAHFAFVSVTTCAAGDRSSARTVVLFGDSHALQWLPALDRVARRDHLRVVTVLKGACPPMPVTVFSTLLGRPYTECARWRVAALRTIVRMHPAAVVVGYFSSEELLHQAHPDQQWADATTTLMSELPADSLRVFVGDDPSWPTAPADCLSLHLHDAGHCTQPVGRGVDEGQHSAELRAARAGGATVLDMAALMCPRGRCPAIAWNVDIYRDTDHVTATFARREAPAFARALRPLTPAGAR